MLFSILPIIPANEITLLSSFNEKYLIGGCAIKINRQALAEELTFLYTQKNKHCFHFEDFGSAKELTEHINDLIPFFFNTAYLKINSRPIVLVCTDTKSQQFESEVTSLLTRLISEQGFIGFEILFINKSQSNNFVEINIPAYYDTDSSDFVEGGSGLKMITDLLLSGKLIGRLLFISNNNTTQLATTIATLTKATESLLNSNEQLSVLIKSHANILSQNNSLQQQNSLLKQQLQNYQSFLTLTKESFNHDVSWYKNETENIKAWSAKEINNLKNWYYWQYEVLPGWYKKLGKIVTRVSGKAQNKNNKVP